MLCAHVTDVVVEKMKKKYLLIVIIFSLIFINCKQNRELLFEKMISSASKRKEKIYLSFNDANQKSGNKYYDYIINSKGINLDYYYKWALTNQKTNFVFELMNCELTTGDLALSILWDRFRVDDENMERLFPIEIVDKYRKTGSNNLYKWVQKDINHRVYITNKTMEIILQKEGVNREININEIKKSIMKKYVKGRDYVITCEFLRWGPTVTGVSWPKYYLWINIFNPNSYELVAEGAIRVVLIENEKESQKLDITDFIKFDDNKQNIQEFEKVFPHAIVEQIAYRNDIEY